MKFRNLLIGICAVGISNGVWAITLTVPVPMTVSSATITSPGSWVAVGADSAIVGFASKVEKDGNTGKYNVTFADTVINNGQITFEILDDNGKPAMKNIATIDNQNNVTQESGWSLISAN